MSCKYPWFSCFLGEYFCLNVETLKFQGPVPKVYCFDIQNHYEQLYTDVFVTYYAAKCCERKKR